MSDYLSDYRKVPGRDVYCVTFAGWVRATLRCHVWLRLFPVRTPSVG